MALRLLRLFEALNRLGTTVVVATHDVQLLKSLPDSLIMRLNKGRLLDPTGKPLEGKHRLNRPGYYEATIPAAAIKGAKEIKISWVDFYR